MVRKIYFLGGVSKENRKATKINKKAISDAGGNPSVLIFPWSRVIEKKHKRTEYETLFKNLGAKEIVFVELSDSLPTIKNKIKKSDIIYLPGGGPEHFVKRFNQKKLITLLNNYSKIIIGNSAGALCLCKRYAVIKAQDYRPKSQLEPGLGLVDFAVSVHYKAPIKRYSGENPDEELKKLSKKVKIYAIPENEALVYDNGKFEFLGNIYLFENGEITKCQQ